MRKFLVAIILCVLPVAGFTKAYFDRDATGGCIVDRYGTNRFWFCSNAQGERDNKSSCLGHDVKSKHPVTVMKHLQIEANYRPNGTSTHYAWVCCNGKFTFHEASKATPTGWSAETKDEKATNGQDCKQKYNVCGEKEGDCEIVPCAEGTDWRESSKSCAARCPSGSAYESDTSNTCVECPETDYQGINEDRVCIKCSSNTQFWKPSAKECGLFSAVSESNKYTNHEFQQCWKCANNNTRFEGCVDASHISMGAADSYVKQYCSLTADVSQGPTTTNAMVAAEAIR